MGWTRILLGVRIGDNSVIRARALVAVDLTFGKMAGDVLAHCIESLNSFVDKRKENNASEKNTDILWERFNREYE